MGGKVGVRGVVVVRGVVGYHSVQVLQSILSGGGGGVRSVVGYHSVQVLQSILSGRGGG